MRLAEKFSIVASRYAVLLAVWIGYTFLWIAANQNPPYSLDVFYTVIEVLIGLGLLNLAASVINHWWHR